MDYDPIRLEVFRNLLRGISEEMGVTLCRTAFSPNIKERRDFSCALFDGNGHMVAQAEQPHVAKRGIRRHGIQSEEMPGGSVGVKENGLRFAR